MGIGPTYPAWKAGVLPLNYTCNCYLFRNSKSQQSLIENTGRRGYYRLNTSGSADARQLMLQFADKQEEKEEEKPPVQDLSLSLFD